MVRPTTSEMYRQCDTCSKQRGRYKKESAKRERQGRRMELTGWEPHYRDDSFKSQYQNLREEKEADQTFFNKLETGRSAPVGRHVWRNRDFDYNEVTGPQLRTAWAVDTLGLETVETVIGRKLAKEEETR